MSKNTFEKILKTRGFKNIGNLDHVILSKNILKRSGDIRKYLFSFYDQNYRQWSLRPDLSISAALKFLKENTKKKRKYWYSGVAYRKSFNKSNNVIKNQLGMEIFQSTNKRADDKQILETAIKITQNKKKNAILKIGNIEIFEALINRLPDMPNRWKSRVIRHFSRENYFNQLLKKLSTNSDIDTKIVKRDELIASRLRRQDKNKTYGGARSLEEILARYSSKQQDPRTKKNRVNAKIIRDYLKIECRIKDAPKILNQFFKKNKLNLIISDDYFSIKKNNLKNIKVLYSSNTGRSNEYYSGMVFTIDLLKKFNKNKHYIVGGRFNLKKIGYRDVPAVGCAVNLDI